MPAARKLGAACGAIIVALLLQSTVFPLLTPRLGADFPVSLVAAFGLAAGPLAGGAAGVATGLLRDMLVGRLIGLGMITHALAGALSGLFGGRLFSENLVVPFLVGMAVTLMEQILFICGARAFGVVIAFRVSVVRSLWCNGLLTAFCFWLVYKLNKKMTYSD